MRLLKRILAHAPGTDAVPAENPYLRNQKPDRQQNARAKKTVLNTLRDFMETKSQ